MIGAGLAVQTYPSQSQNNYLTVEQPRSAVDFSSHAVTENRTQSGETISRNIKVDKAFSQKHKKSDNREDWALH